MGLLFPVVTKRPPRPEIEHSSSGARDLWCLHFCVLVSFCFFAYGRCEDVLT